MTLAAWLGSSPMRRWPGAGVVVAVAITAVPVAVALETNAAQAIQIPPIAGFAMVSESGPRWSSLTAVQRDALKPLEEDWPQIDASRKQKWLEVAARYPSLSAVERQRLQQRMTEWARLSPSQRGEVRLNFQQASRTPASERQAQWQAYQALPAEEKSRLASRAAEAGKTPPRPATAATVAARTSPDGRPAATERPRPSTAKSNLVPNPLFTTVPRPVGPTLVRPGTGATTTLVNRPPTPPLHQQPGLPKVVATPVMVDPVTLLPQRGPQAAAVVAPAAAAATTPPSPSAAPAESAPASAVAPATPAASAPAPSGPPYTDTSIGER